MTAISTIISLYKQKYYTIGRNTGAENTGDNIINDWKRTSNITKLTSAAVGYENAVASLNIGLATFNNIQKDLNGSIVDMVRSITLFEERESELTKTFKVGTAELALRTLAYTDLQKTLKASNSEMARYRANMEENSAFSGKLFTQQIKAGNAYIKSQITAQHYLAKNTNLTDEQIQSLELYSAGAGRTLDRQITATDAMAESIAGTTDNMDTLVAKSQINESILAGIANLSADIRTQYKGIGGNLENAVLKSKRLGISMEQLHNTGKGLLDIEASVGKELEYQLLSGQRLTKQGKSLTDAYRQATLTGDMDKQADIMKDVLETQQEVLNGTNFAAKEALAATLNMSLKDLMHMKEKKDLQDKINKSMVGTGKNIDDLFKDPKAMEAFKLDLKNSGTKDNAALLTSINALAEKEETRRSPAENIQKMLESIRETGLNVKLKDDAKGTAVEKLKNAREAGKGYEAKMSEPFKKLFAEESMAQLVGRYQITQAALNLMNNTINSFSKTIPYFGTALSKVITKMKEVAQLVYGTHTIASGNRTVDKTKAPMGSGGGKTIEGDDTILNVNDGVIAKFHPNDKITTVVASPYGAMNERIAGKIANPKSNNSSHSEITQLTNAINKLISSQPAPQQTDNKSIVSAIQSALGNVNITVALDPMAIHKEIKFRSGNLNKGTSV